MKIFDHGGHLIMSEFYHFSAHKNYQLSIIICLWYAVQKGGDTMSQALCTALAVIAAETEMAAAALLEKLWVSDDPDVRDLLSMHFGNTKPSAHRFLLFCASVLSSEKPLED
jgi:hypothetical protein